MGAFARLSIASPPAQWLRLLMESEIVLRHPHIFSAVVATLLVTAAVFFSVWVWPELMRLRKEIDVMHQELSTVKPWAKSLTALRETMAGQSPHSTIGQRSSADAPSTVEANLAERRYGPASARFSLSVFSDIECPFCKQYHQVSTAVVDQGGGNISMTYKHVPLHKEASRAESLAVECAFEQGGNQAFYKLLNALFARTRGNGNGLSAALSDIAQPLGLDPQLLQRCIASERYMVKISRDMDEGIAVGVKVTPTTVITDHQTGRSRIISGAVSENELMQAISLLVSEQS